MENILVVILGIVGGIIAAFAPLFLAIYAYGYVEERTDNRIFPWLVAIAILIGFAYMFSLWSDGDIPIERPCNHC